jgi:hypothetical protein
MPCYKKGAFFREFREYQFFNEKIYEPSPGDHGDPDPFADYRKELESQGTEASLKEASKFRPRKQFLFNALIIEDSDGASPKDGIKVVKTGVTVKRAIVDLDHDEDEWGDITNLETGYNITIDKEGEGRDTTYTVKGVHKGERDIRKVLEEQGVDINKFALHDLDAQCPPESFETLEAIVENLKKVPTPVAVAPGPQMPTAPSPVMAQGSGVEIPNIPAPPED